MGCSSSKREVPSILKQAKITDSCIKPPEIDNETEFYSSRSSTEVPNS